MGRRAVLSHGESLIRENDEIKKQGALETRNKVTGEVGAYAQIKGERERQRGKEREQSRWGSSAEQIAIGHVPYPAVSSALRLLLYDAADPPH
jgi:hypothetical protein